MVKFCKDCANYKPGAYWMECFAPQIQTLNLVSGKWCGSQEAKEMREGMCGEEARWFVPKVSIFRRLWG